VSSIRADLVYDWLFEQGHQPDVVEEDEEIIVCCPLCDDDRARLYISTEHGGWHCFHCGEEGNLHQLLMSAYNLTGAEAFEASEWYTQDGDVWGDDTGFSPTAPVFKRQAEAIPSELVLPRQVECGDFTTMAAEPYADYLANRGIDPAVAEAYGIGYARSGRLRDRVVIPVMAEGKLYTYVARTLLTHCPNCEEKLDDCTCTPFKYPKVLTPHKKDGGINRGTLFNYDHVAAQDGPVIVVEGVFDALRFPEHAVALLGASASRAQVAQLLKLARGGRDIVIALDGDKAGWLGAYKLATALTAEMITPLVALLPDGTDPGDMTREAFKEALVEAQEFHL
jgi:DNA primase